MITAYDLLGRISNQIICEHSTGFYHWEHGYASTIYAAQGKTVDEILIHVDTSQKAVMGHEAWYLAVTMVRRGAKVFTDHPDNVPEAISSIMLQESAIEAREKFVKESKKGEKDRSVRKGRNPGRIFDP